MPFPLGKIEYALIEAEELSAYCCDGGDGNKKKQQEYGVAVSQVIRQIHGHCLIDYPEDGGADKQKECKAQQDKYRMYGK